MIREKKPKQTVGVEEVVNKYKSLILLLNWSRGLWPTFYNLYRLIVQE